MDSLDREIWNKYRAETEVFTLTDGVQIEVDLEQAFRWCVNFNGAGTVEVRFNSPTGTPVIFGAITTLAEFEVPPYTGFQDVIFLTLVAGAPTDNAQLIVQRLRPREDAQGIVTE